MAGKRTKTRKEIKLNKAITLRMERDHFRTWIN